MCPQLGTDYPPQPVYECGKEKSNHSLWIESSRPSFLPPPLSSSLVTHLVVPLPRLRIDRLAYRPQDLEASSRIFGDVVIPFSHEGPDGSRSCIEVSDAVLVHHIPKAAGWDIGRKGW